MMVTSKQASNLEKSTFLHRIVEINLIDFLCKLHHKFDTYFLDSSNHQLYPMIQILGADY